MDEDEDFIDPDLEEDPLESGDDDSGFMREAKW